MKTENPKPAHVEDIHKYTLELSKEIENAHSRAGTSLLLGGLTPDIGDWLNEQLSLDIWKKAGGGWKAEILLTCGGPLVKIELDSRWNCGTLFHSWGWCDSHGEKQEWNISETATEILKDFIEDCCLN